MNTQEALSWIAEIFEEPAGRINAGMSREEIPGWDSLGTLSLLAAFDERFDVHLSEQDIDGLHSVKDIVEILRRHGSLSS